jgi:hypothetical protein
MAVEPEISPEQLATFRRCTFDRRVFTPRSSLWAKRRLDHGDLPPDPRNEGQEWHVSKPYSGQPFDPEEYELRDGDWDHEHCDVCWFKVEEGTSYWPNIDPDAGQVDLCEGCYPRVMRLLGNLQAPSD